MLDLSYPIVENPTLPPHRCAVCMTDAGKFVDTRARFPGHPADNYNVYICVGCVKQMYEHTVEK